ncbi:cytochrome b5 [Dendrothele bispora CBS 962.96]|uniref:Cytochrome b5 n=1 Tax=Dendrothele bispora (strain CBS 962.96) TaxID=1314807 RepID=A0A4S8L5R4_DENBC|nr:cytochrome b5 [Dendrothele bispora CBS 962.96]
MEPPSEPKVKDPSIPNRMVSNKTANRPFLAHKEYQEKQKQLHEAWLERKKIRDEKIARGEEVGPEEKDPTAQEEVGVLGLLKFFLYMIIFIALAGKFITGSYTWDYQGKWLQLKTYLPGNQRLFSERLLAEFDGNKPGRPIYLAIDGDVYDVTKGKAYQPGGSYHILTGVDAARAFATGCFKDHRTYDLRGLSDKELDSIDHWKKFYSEHKDYFKVGRVSHPPIDPASPIPEHCDPKKAAKSQQVSNKEIPGKQPKDAQKDRNEL